MQELQTQDIQRADESMGSRALLGAAVAYTILSVLVVVAAGTTPAAADHADGLPE